MDDQGFKCILFFSIFITSIFISKEQEEELLLDMVALGREVKGWLTWPAEIGWKVAQTAFNGSLHYNYFVCNVEAPAGQDNWLRTTFIQRHPTASRVFVELRFVVRDCNSFNGASLTCKETFNLYASDSDADIGTSFRKSNFRKVATIAPDEISKMGHLKMNTETRVVENLSRKGFYLAFQDNGACVALFSVRVYYKICPATIKSLAAFPETVAGGDKQNLRKVAGQCVENAVSANQPLIYCTAEGEWVVPVGQCHCREGYQAFGNECQAPPETPVVTTKGPKLKTEEGNVTVSIPVKGEQCPLVTAVISSVLTLSVCGAVGLLCAISKKCKRKVTHTECNQDNRDVSKKGNSDATQLETVYQSLNPNTIQPDAIYQSLNP